MRKVTSVRPCSIPADSALAAYADTGAYTDCYTVTASRAVTQAEFVEAFYTTTVFKLERLLLATVLARPSTDADAGRLAAGATNCFAVWVVERRLPDQILLAAGPTRSWLMAEPVGPATTLYFGSAVVPKRSDNGGTPTMDWQFRALLGFHKMYSRILLGAARRKLLGK